MNTLIDIHVPKDIRQLLKNEKYSYAPSSFDKLYLNEKTEKHLSETIGSLETVALMQEMFSRKIFDNLTLQLENNSKVHFRMVDDNGNVKNLNQAFMADAIGTTVGAMLGTSTVTTYVESASGVNVGGRSGVTSLTTAICFAVALLFAPLFLAIPAQATAAALILVGVMMMHDIRKVDFSNYVTAIPCFVCIVLMPLTYSISDGILMGVVSYVLIHLLSGTLKDKDERDNMNWGTILLAILFICRYAFL